MNNSNVLNSFGLFYIKNGMIKLAKVHYIILKNEEEQVKTALLRLI